MRAAEPLSTLKAIDRWLNRPLRIDAKRNVVTYELKGFRAITSRVRAQIARLQNHVGGAK